MSETVPASASKAKAKPAYMAHFVVRTARYDETVSWYMRFFDAKTVHADGNLTFLTFDDEHHRVAIANVPDLKDFADDVAGVDHVAFSMADLSDLIASYERLKALGIVPAFPINHGPTTSLYYVDPNGVKVELQVDNTSLPNGPASFFGTSAFAENPIGVVFDPDVLAAKFHAGVDVNELLQQGSTNN